MIIVDVKTGSPAKWHKLQAAAYTLAWMEGATTGITFDAEAHKYFHDGKEVPSVSAILRETKRQPSYDGFNPFFAQKGSYVHRAIELEVAGKLDEATVDDRVKPYLVAWRKFREDFKPVIHATEAWVYHPIYEYAGTFDLLLTLPGEDEGMGILYLAKDETYKWRHIRGEKFDEAKSEWLLALGEYYPPKDDDLWA